MKSIKMLMIAVFSIMTISVFSQGKAGKKDTATHTTMYTCPMHPEMVFNKPGTCPKCGMKLNLSTKEQMKKDVVKNYACPVHTTVMSNKPGKCPQCGMDLRLSSKEEMKAGMNSHYTCPMHADVVSGKDGKCPKCGMSLTKVKAKN